MEHIEHAPNRDVSFLLFLRRLGPGELGFLRMGVAPLELLISFKGEPQGKQPMLGGGAEKETNTHKLALLLSSLWFSFGTYFCGGQAASQEMSL